MIFTLFFVQKKKRHQRCRPRFSIPKNVPKKYIVPKSPHRPDARRCYTSPASPSSWRPFPPHKDQNKGRLLQRQQPVQEHKGRRPEPPRPLILSPILLKPAAKSRLPIQQLSLLSLALLSLISLHVGAKVVGCKTKKQTPSHAHKKKAWVQLHITQRRLLVCHVSAKLTSFSDRRHSPVVLPLPPCAGLTQAESIDPKNASNLLVYLARYVVLSTAETMSSFVGNAIRSRFSAYGMGTSAPVTWNNVFFV